MADEQVTGMALGGAVRVLWVDVTEAASETIRRHNLTERAATLAAELTVANVLLGAWVKGDERILLQLQAEYPAGVAFMGEYDAHGQLRARFVPDTVPGDGLEITGLLLAIKSDAEQEMYRGITEIIDEPVADALERHLRISDQVPALVRIDVTPRAGSPRAVGLVVERLPADPGRPALSAEAFDEAVAPLRVASSDDMAQDVADGTWLGAPLEVLERRAIAYRCRCSRERVQGMLVSLGDEEVRAMRDEDAGADITCQFCNEHYHFDVADLNAILLPDAEA